MLVLIQELLHVSAVLLQHSHFFLKFTLPLQQSGVSVQAILHCLKARVHGGAHFLLPVNMS